MKNLTKLVIALFFISTSTPLLAAPLDNLFKDYLEIQTLLAKDTFAGVTDAAKKLAADAAAIKDPELNKLSVELSKSTQIEAARDQFIKVSLIVVKLAKKNKSKDREIVNCPMKKARWVQAKGDIKNPYYGAEMLECGVKE